MEKEYDFKKVDLRMLVTVEAGIGHSVVSDSLWPHGL